MQVAEATPPLGKQVYRPSRLLVLLVCGLALALAFLMSVATGASPISPGKTVAILLDQIGVPAPWAFSQTEAAILLQLRLPRALTGLCVGAALAAGGAALQGLFRNPLAEPTLVGVSSGAALGAVAVIVLGVGLLGDMPALLRAFAVPLAAFVGGALSTFLVYRIASNRGQTVVATMLLAGIAIQAVASAFIGVLIFVSDDDALRTLNFWLLGSLGGATWNLLLPALLFLVPPTLVLLAFPRSLNAFLLGETEAGYLGINAEVMKRTLIVMIALGTGASVAVAGIVGFVGLVVPHMIRLAAGPDHRTLLPASALLGGALLLGADLLARLIVAPAELPIGIVTSMVGGPFFLWLLIRHRRRFMF